MIRHAEIQKRKRDRLRTLKTRDIVGHGKNIDDPLVIAEEGG